MSKSIFGDAHELGMTMLLDVMLAKSDAHARFVVDLETRHDSGIDTDYYSVSVHADGMNPDPTRFGPDNVCASVHARPERGIYMVYSHGERSGAYLQSAGRVREYGTASDALAAAIDAVKMELPR